MLFFIPLRLLLFNSNISSIHVSSSPPSSDFPLYHRVCSPFVLIRPLVFLNCFSFKFYSHDFYVVHPFLFRSIVFYGIFHISPSLLAFVCLASSCVSLSCYFMLNRTRLSLSIPVSIEKKFYIYLRKILFK